MSEIHFYRRFKKWDYAKGAMLFVTISTNPRGEIFGRVINGRVVLNELGKEVEKTLRELARRAIGLQLFERVVMPDHVHFNIRIVPGLTEPLKALGKAIAGFKNHLIRFSKDLPGCPILGWQQGYHDLLCLSRRKIEATARYIAYNPAKYELMHNRHEALRIREPIDSFRFDGDDYWRGVGNVALLSAENWLVSLRISRKCTPKMIEKIVARMVKAADQGFVIISGFISPGERAVRDMLAKREGAKFIRVLPRSMAIDYKPESVYIDAFLENRYLEIAEGNTEDDFSRGVCLEINEEIVRIARALPEHRDQTKRDVRPEHRDQADEREGYALYFKVGVSGKLELERL